MARAGTDDATQQTATAKTADIASSQALKKRTRQVKHRRQRQVQQLPLHAQPPPRAREARRDRRRRPAVALAAAAERVRVGELVEQRRAGAVAAAAIARRDRGAAAAPAAQQLQRERGGKAERHAGKHDEHHEPGLLECVLLIAGAGVLRGGVTADGGGSRAARLVGDLCQQRRRDARSNEPDQRRAPRAAGAGPQRRR